MSSPEPIVAYERPLVVVEPVEATCDLPAPPPESDSTRPGKWARLLPGAGPVFAVVMLCAILSRVIWLSLPANSLIFDEA